MTCKIKNLGFAIVVVAAMSMTMASAVQASEMHATHQQNIVITGHQVEQHKFQITHNTQKPISTTCTTADFENTVAGSGAQITAHEVTVTATYSGCQGAGLAAVVRMNGCKYTLTGTNTNGTTVNASGLTANVDITGCTPGKQGEVIAGGGACTITVPEQHHLQHIVFSNTTEAGKPHHTHANITITGIKYETHGALCGHTATVPRTDAQYTGQVTARAYKDTGIHLTTEHNHQFIKSTHLNEQVGLLVT